MGTLIFEHTKHKEMWDWLSKNPTETKNSFFDIHRDTHTDYPLNGCYACEYASSVGIVIEIANWGGPTEMCDNCPLNLPNGCSDASFYDTWYAAQPQLIYLLTHKDSDSPMIKEFTKIVQNAAMQIRDAPVKGHVITR